MATKPKPRRMGGYGTQAISYRLVENETSDQRREALEAHLWKDSSWDETTSFWLIRTDKQAKTVALGIARAAKLHDDDQLLVIDLRTDTAFYIGPHNNQPMKMYFHTLETRDLASEPL